jgi:hypothetical protein
MKKLFVVTTDPTLIEQDKLFQEWIESTFNWWHWIQQTWLLIDDDGTHSAASIRDQCKQFFPGITTMIIEITSQGTTWAGFGPTGKTDPDKDMFAWLKEYWKFP